MSRRGSLFLESRQLAPTGEYLDLGSFPSILHKHDLRRSLGIDVHFAFLDTREAKVSMTFSPSDEDPSALSPTSSYLSKVKYELYNDTEKTLDTELHYDFSNSTWRTQTLQKTSAEERDDTRFASLFFLPPLIVDSKVHFDGQLTQVWFEDHLNAIAYLGPLRSAPERLYGLSSGALTSPGTRGEHAPQVLYHDKEAVSHVNTWFNKLGIPYILKVLPMQEVALIGERVAITLVDKRTNTPVTLLDVGFGVNQVLPILIEAVSSGHRIRGEPVVCVEQPEIHLHPKLQAELAELFVTTSQSGKQWIIETHSELLILRMQRLIREKRLDATDLSVIYVDPNDPDVEGSAVKQLGLDECGDFVSDWPDGFFEESYHEMIPRLEEGDVEATYHI